MEGGYPPLHHMQYPNQQQMWANFYSAGPPPPDDGHYGGMEAGWWGGGGHTQPRPLTWSIPIGWAAPGWVEVGCRLAWWWVLLAPGPCEVRGRGVSAAVLAVPASPQKGSAVVRDPAIQAHRLLSLRPFLGPRVCRRN